MRLSSIKLAGFKSFVDSTTLQLPANMTCVVGPNGCGKSNIIDAIRWVMGESAASRLRGDSLTDVIFSGSHGRKPVGQATVELVFDNSDGQIQGEYGQYAEISVKRQVSRDGQSLYLLNGVRCRRRDITDLFLGTGLGPRSYSIIEQGMISQIVEAHPEELRGYLEEAAGISKYKERRKETESRLRATRENVERVRDVREEVSQQLGHLDRQARAAERWQALKAEQTHKEAELKALEYRDLERQQSGEAAEVSRVELEIERQLAAQRELEVRLEMAREQHGEYGEALNSVQAEVYQVGSELARIEQQIRFSRETTERLQRAQDELEREAEQLTVHLAADREQLERLSLELAEGEPRLESLRQWEDDASGQLHAAETALADWQAQWDQHLQAGGDLGRAVEVERTRLAYLDRQSLDATRRREALQREQQEQDPQRLVVELETLAADFQLALARQENLTKQLEQHKEAQQAELAAERQQQSALAEAQRQWQTERGRLASLEAWQHAALGQDGEMAAAWLSQQGLAAASRLGGVLQVAAGWEQAVETVLAEALEAVLVADPQMQASQLDAVDGANLLLLAEAAAPIPVRPERLAAKVRGPSAVLAWLDSVHWADNLTAAQFLLPGLAEGESVITPRGEWLGCGWARVRRAKDGQSGVLARERELQTLRMQLETQAQLINELETQLEDLYARKRVAERAGEEIQHRLHQAHRQQAELAGRLQGQRDKLDSARVRVARIEREGCELAEQLATVAQQEQAARAKLEEVVARMGASGDERQRLEGARRQHLERREEARMQAREATEQAHAQALALESKRSASAALSQSLQRLSAQQALLAARREELQAQQAQDGDPLTELEQERQAYLERRLVADRRLVEARQALESSDAACRQLEHDRQTWELGLNQLREALAERRLAAQALALRAQQLTESVLAADLLLEALLAELPEQATPMLWQRQLDELEQKIRRLEPVNLAAIQEHAEKSQRLHYLDSQLADLMEAMETLQGAIRKIDRETRARFKETFERVNSGMQELFPRLFGGGQGYLELTGQDLLDTGVAIMARPPGKRVSNISLLSGGEKALTAVSLVFAIFGLNPAPFCLLDEVDAPLDEANVGRFSAMVGEMSEKVQFIFVSHNKATMEAASQLCGVTMREPGVSRLVQVDLSEAAKLAGAA